VPLLELGKMLSRKSLRQPNQGWPQTPMDIGDLSINCAADEYFIAIPHRAGESKNLATTGMCPPTPTDRLAGDRSSQ
jgi:hypothetical protein